MRNGRILRVFFFLCMVIHRVGFPATEILVFGDFGTGDSPQSLVANSMISYCREKHCDFAITVGDNIYPRGIENNDDGSPNFSIVKRRFVDNYKLLNIPIYMSLGNHDISNGGFWSKIIIFFSTTESVNKNVLSLMNNEIAFTNHPDNPKIKDSLSHESRLWNFPAPFYGVREKDNVHLWAIDTNTFPHSPVDANSQLNQKMPPNFKQKLWLNNGLSSMKDGWKIVFGHMPLYSHGHHGFRNFGAIRDFRDSIIDTLCEHKVDFYLSGHDHHLEVDQHRCKNGHVLTAVVSGAAAKHDRVYQWAFPWFNEEQNLLWANGKHFNGNKNVFKNDDFVLGFSYLKIDDNGTALLTMHLSDGSSKERKNGCFTIKKGTSITPMTCP
jgi:tartrate-resistant acid phosphatase type 5